MTDRAATVHPGDVWEDTEDGERVRVLETPPPFDYGHERGRLHPVTIERQASGSDEPGAYVRQQIWHPRWVLVERAGVAVSQPVKPCHTVKAT